MALLLQSPHSSCCFSFGERRDWLGPLSSSRVLCGGSLGRAAERLVPPATRKKAPLPQRARVSAIADQTKYDMNLNKYIVTLEPPLGIRFALSVNGRIFVHSLTKGGNAEKTRMVMVGDALKKASNASSGGFTEIRDLRDAEMLLKDKGSSSLILERPFSPYPIQQVLLNGVYHTLFNRGRVALATWNRNVLRADIQSSSEENGNSGFALFSPKFLKSDGWMLIASQGSVDSKLQSNRNPLDKHKDEIISLFSDEENENVEWSYGAFPPEEYIKALERGKGDLYYNHSLGMQYSKIIEQIYVGSCIQTENDVQTLSELGITAILNFQSESERANWGINSESIIDACHQKNILMVNYPIIREVDSLDLRRKLPFCVGVLLRLLRKNFRIFVTCTTGFHRSPACVIAYLHWIQDTPLHAAYNFVTGLHACRPDRAAIVWATWDLIATVDNGKYDGPPTHAISFLWSNNGREGDEVFLVGDFTNNWKDPIKAAHKSGSKFEAEVRLRHGKYHYKFIVNGQWRHSSALPTESDESGNVNNVIRVGDVARTRSFYSHLKDPTDVKVIERPLTEDERFMLAYAARRIAFSVCPIRLAPK